jgi:photosystem II stability/assembly factor-like uncharacterized protein
VGIFKKVDSSANWTNIVNPALYPAGLWHLVHNPTNENEIFVAADSQGVFKTNDGGTIWTAKNNGFQDVFNFTAFIIDPNNPAILFVDTYDGTTGGLFKSTNSGDTWTLIPFFNNSYVDTVAIDKNNSKIIYATKNSDNTVAKSIDGGTSWSTILTNTTGFTGVSIDPNNSSVIYVNFGNTINKSLDGGTTWMVYTSGLRTITTSTAVTIDPTNSLNLYVGTNQGGVYHSSNGGISWSARNAGLTDFRINALKFDPNAPLLYAGTFVAGLFSLIP